MPIPLDLSEKVYKIEWQWKLVWAAILLLLLFAGLATGAIPGAPPGTSVIGMLLSIPIALWVGSRITWRHTIVGPSGLSVTGWPFGPRLLAWHDVRELYVRRPIARFVRFLHGGWLLGTYGPTLVVSSNERARIRIPLGFFSPADRQEIVNEIARRSDKPAIISMATGLYMWGP
jgi:hypothetical protein